MRGIRCQWIAVLVVCASITAYAAEPSEETLADFRTSYPRVVYPHSNPYQWNLAPVDVFKKMKSGGWSCIICYRHLMNKPADRENLDASIFSDPNYNFKDASASERIANFFAETQEAGLDAVVLFPYRFYEQEYEGIKGCRTSPEYEANNLVFLGNLLEAVKNGANLKGVWFRDHSYIQHLRFNCPFCTDALKERLRERYDAEQLAELGIDVETIVLPPTPSDKVLWAEWCEFTADCQAASYRNIRDEMHKTRPDLLLGAGTLCGHAMDTPWATSYSRLGEVLDAVSADTRSNGVIEEAFILDLLRSGTQGLAMMESENWFFWNWTSDDRREVELSLALPHADGISAIDIESIYPVETPWARDNHWTLERWLAFSRVLNKIEKVKKYLAGTESASKVALVFSERTVCNNQDDAKMPWDFYDVYHLGPSEYFMNVAGIYSALAQRHIQVDPIYGEHLSAEKLAPYRVLFLADARSLDTDEEEAIRDWVRGGGVLVATASSTVEDRWGRTRGDYGLGDVFGARYVGTKRFSGYSAFAAGELDVGYNSDYACDVVEASSAAVTGSWPDGAAAVIENTYGKGRSVFLSGRLVGMCYKGRDYVNANYPRHKEFYDGVAELLERLVLSADEGGRGLLPAVVDGASKETECVVRVQPNNDAPERLIVHLLNYDATPVEDVRVSVAVPDGTTPKRVFDPVDDNPIRFTVSEGRVDFTARSFDIHTMAVIELR